MVALVLPMFGVTRMPCKFCAVVAVKLMAAALELLKRMVAAPPALPILFTPLGFTS